MAIGDVGIWRDSAGSQIPGTSYAAFNFATQERNDNSTYSKPDAATIQFGEAGLYLIRWIIQQDDSSNNRTNGKTRAIQATGSGDFFSTHHTGYSRNNNNRVYSMAGRAFINAAVNDQVTIQDIRDTDAPTGGSLVDASFLEVVKLGEDGDFDYAIYEQSTGNQTYGGTTPNDVGFEATPIETNTSSIELQANDTDIRLKRDNAKYWFMYSISGDGGGSRTQRVSRSVTGSTLIPGSGSYAYQRNGSNEYAGMLGEFMHEVGTTDEDVSIQCWRGDGVAANDGGADVDGSWNTIASEVTCLVIDMPDHWNSAAYYDSTGLEDISGGFSGDLSVFRDTLWEDSPFSRDSNTDMTVSSAVDAWCTGTTVTARVGITGGTRFTGGITWEIEGTDQTRGEHKQYTRGNQGTQDTFGGGWCWGGIYALAANDTLQGQVIDRGDNGNDDETRPSYTAAFFLDLDNLEASGGTDALLADDIESASEVGSPSVGQEHALTADDVESSSEVGSPSLGQEHGLSADDIESASEVSSPAVGQVHNLAADDSEATSEVTAPAIGQAHTLSAGDVESSSETSSPSIGQEHSLSADSVEASTELTAPNLSSNSTVDNLLADDLEAASEVSAPSLSQVEDLEADSVELTSEVSSPDLDQIHNLLGDDVSSTSEITSPSVTQEHTLSADSVEAATNVDSPTLSEENTLSADSVESATELTTPSVAQVHVLLIDADLTVQSEVSSPALSETNVMLAESVECIVELTNPRLDPPVFMNARTKQRRGLHG